MKNLLYISVLLFAMSSALKAQDPRFGGPFTTLSFNKYGPSIAVGGGGTFLVKNNYYIGVFGQGTSDAFIREGNNGYEDFSLKSRQTGFWFGYNHRFKKIPYLSTSIYNKVGFGQVQLNNEENSMNYYDKTIVLTPNVEMSFAITSFFEIGIALYYEIFTEVDLFHYTEKDFNSYGASVLFKFKKM